MAPRVWLVLKFIVLKFIALPYRSEVKRCSKIQISRKGWAKMVHLCYMPKPL